MAYTVRLFLAGLVALAHDRAGRLHVLLPSAAHGHHRHVPILIGDHRNADCRLSHPGQGDEIARRLKTGSPLTGYLLAGEEVTLSGATAGTLAPASGKWRRRWYHDYMGAVPASRDACADCAWIAPMWKIDPARRSVAPRHFERPRPDEIAAKMALAGVKGTLRAFRMAEVCGRVPSLTLKRLGTGMPMRAFRQALADSAVVEIEAEGPVTFELSRFAGGGGGGGEAAGTRRLTIAPKDGAREADVLLANLAPLEQAMPCDPGFVPPPALHFDLYYRLAATPPPPWEWMLPLPHCGMRSAAADRVCEPWPPVIQAVGRAAAGAQGSIERPICTLVIFDGD